MVILIALVYVIVGVVEVLLWEKRDGNKLAVYVVLMIMSLVFAELMGTGVHIPVISPIGEVISLVKKLIQGGS
ncbi:MAG: hypothetical protein GX331_02095 [Firmicutes bacterium]|jgi:hypothetical protein|nr:hypothetical protein [Bacillota bacterium]